MPQKPQVAVDANAVIQALRDQLSAAHYELAIMTARATQAEANQGITAPLKEH